MFFAVAGRDKTMLQIYSITENRRIQILAHTVNNETHLRTSIISRFGFLSD